ncbi:MAG: HEAT repeat domain-containing protein [Planctomycetaceae bacterium]
MMTVLPDNVLDSLLGPEVDPVAAGLVLRQIGTAEPSHGLRLLAELAARPDELCASDPAIVGALLRGIHMLVLRDDHAALAAMDPEVIEDVEQALPDRCSNRYLLLHLLAVARTPAALGMLMTYLQTSPPTHWMEAAQVLSPLMQHRDWPVDAVFPLLLEAISHPSVAAPAIDLANFVTRRGLMPQHPATHHVEMLNRLLSAVTARLERFEQDPATLGEDVATVQERLSQAVSLSVSLCDALGLIGAESSRPRLEEAMQLRHRRVQCEAAGALTRMGSSEGRERLISLASEPSARLRVIAYAEELGIEDSVDPAYRSDSALAESEVAIWLSQPDRFGVPPTSVETIEQRPWMWPGYSDRVDCFLVRFHYDLGQRSYSNIAIAGPVVFALACDLADMQADDIYAIYAGWQAEHNDIFAVAANQFNASQRRVVDTLQSHLDRAGYEELKAELFGVFLDEHAAVFSAMREGKPCRVLTDGLETIHIPVAGRARPLQATDLWNLFKGRKMLRTFNPQG